MPGINFGRTAKLAKKEAIVLRFEIASGMRLKIASMLVRPPPPVICSEERRKCASVFDIF